MRTGTAGIASTRHRGTEITRNNDTISIRAWQKNVSSIGGNQVELPTTISMTLSATGTIQAIDLGSDFRGSKGPGCNHPYLNRILSNQLNGRKFNASLSTDLTTQNLKCFHLSEVLLAALSFYQEQRKQLETDATIEECEQMIASRDDNDYLMTGTQRFGGSLESKEVAFELRFEDLFSKTTVVDGVIDSINDAMCHITVDGETISSMEITESLANRRFRSLFRATVQTVKEIKRRLAITRSPFHFTNMIPNAFIGLFFQGLAAQLFPTDRASFITMLNYFQRPEGNPACIGGVTSHRELPLFPGSEEFREEMGL